MDHVDGFREPTMDGIKHFKFEIDYCGLEFHRDFGDPPQTGWFAQIYGAFPVRFGTLKEAIHALGLERTQQLYDMIDYLNGNM